MTGFRGTDCAFGALAQLYPDKVFAASDGGNTGLTIGGYDADRKPFIYVDFISGAWGGRPWADGLDGNTTMFANMASFSVEVIEAENPLEVLDYEFVPDTAGCGRLGSCAGSGYGRRRAGLRGRSNGESAGRGRGRNIIVTNSVAIRASAVAERGVGTGGVISSGSTRRTTNRPNLRLSAGRPAG